MCNARPRRLTTNVSPVCHRLTNANSNDIARSDNQRDSAVSPFKTRRTYCWVGLGVRMLFASGVRTCRFGE